MHKQLALHNVGYAQSYFHSFTASVNALQLQHLQRLLAILRIGIGI